jgi:hypothetical protein
MLCVVVGLASLLLVPGCGDSTAPRSGPSQNTNGGGRAEKDQSACPYDEKLTKYLPESEPGYYGRTI